MFDKSSVIERLVRDLPNNTFNYVLSKLPDSEIEVAYTDSEMGEPEDFVILAWMKDMMQTSEFDVRANRDVREEFMSDYQKFSAHWTERAKYFCGRDIHSVSGNGVEYTGLQMSVGLKMRLEGMRARVFYGLKHPERMEKLDNDGKLFDDRKKEHTLLDVHAAA